VQLFDEDFGKADDLMGYIELNCDTFQFEPVQWFPVLQGKGEVGRKNQTKPNPLNVLLSRFKCLSSILDHHLKSL
jgi:hypothetical protein